jgi:hypothetical protein
MDTMPQFGALVTNGQEEIASLAYLITMEWAEANAEATGALGRYYAERMATLAEAHAQHISGVEGWNHMTSLCFRELAAAKAFVKTMTEHGLDISVQSYKADCPPVVLTKLPLIADRAVIDFVIARMHDSLRHDVG